jgi:hypothetical protein
MTHTPGPWRLAENDETLIVTEALDDEGNCTVIADIATGIPRSEQFANARLIAAAPELLKALQEVKEQAFTTGTDQYVGLPDGAWQLVLATLKEYEL